MSLHRKCILGASLLLFGTPACTAGEVSPPPPSAPVTGAGEATPGGATTAPTAGPKASCERLIRCVADSRPAAAGGLVNLYGEASNCWKGSLADATACGKACDDVFAQEACPTSADLARSYAAYCVIDLRRESGEKLRSDELYDVALDYDAGSGGTAAFRNLKGGLRYDLSGASAWYPTMRLEPRSGGGAGTSRSFEGSILGNSTKALFEELTVRRLRPTAGGACLSLSGALTAGEGER